MISDELIEQLKRHEGFRARPYEDTRGIYTVGYGRNLDANPYFNGHVIRLPLDEERATAILRYDVQHTEEHLGRVWLTFRRIPEGPRRDALLNMAFNVGVGGFMGFHRLLAAVHVDDWKQAAHEALNSQWARQVGHRATELARQIETGKYA